MVRGRNRTRATRGRIQSTLHAIRATPQSTGPSTPITQPSAGLRRRRERPGTRPRARRTERSRGRSSQRLPRNNASRRSANESSSRRGQKTGGSKRLAPTGLRVLICKTAVKPIAGYRDPAALSASSHRLPAGYGTPSSRWKWSACCPWCCDRRRGSGNSPGSSCGRCDWDACPR